MQSGMFHGGNLVLPNIGLHNKYSILTIWENVIVNHEANR
jgi:hypothetical protein